MVSRLMHLCGLYLGLESEFPPAAPDNQEGFWENVNFVRINDKVLAHSGAAWDLPPEVPQRWASQPEFISLHNEAADLIHRFNEHEPWGWKDPRNSLTLPFWLDLIPNLKVVLCLRNPLEVTKSLSARNFSSIPFGLQLWLTYNQGILRTARPDDIVVTHYDAYFYDPRAELRRVLGLLNIPASEKDIEHACSAISGYLRHHQVRTEPSADIPTDVLKCYLELCTRAGPVYQSAQKAVGNDSPWLRDQSRIIRAGEEAIQKLEIQVGALQQTVDEQDGRIASLSKALAERDGQLALRDGQLAEREGQIASLSEALTNRAAEIVLLNRAVAELDAQPPWEYAKKITRRGITRLRSVLKPGSGTP